MAETAKTNPLIGIFRTWAWILLLWSVYRYFTNFPEVIDEFIFKPLIFVVPVLVYVFRIEKRSWDSLGITWKNFFPSLYAGFGIGFLFAIQGLIANWLKYGEITINPINAFKEYGFFLLVISLATSAWEELLGRGFLFNRFFEHSKENLVYAAAYSTAMFIALHVPILLTSLKFQGVTLLMFFATSVAISFANTILFRYTKSLTGPILVHLFWNMAVALYL